MFKAFALSALCGANIAFGGDVVLPGVGNMLVFKNDQGSTDATLSAHELSAMLKAKTTKDKQLNEMTALENRLATATGTLNTLKDKYGVSGANKFLQRTECTRAGNHGWTDSHGVILECTISPKRANSKFSIKGSFIWGGDNPNGHWYLDVTPVGGSTVNIGTYLKRDEEEHVGDTVSILKNMDYKPSSPSMTPLKFRIQWHHSIQNGGRISIGAPFSTTLQAGEKYGESSLVITEISQ